MQDHLVTWAGWSQKLNILAVATSRGSLLLIDPSTPRAALPMEKTEGSITSGAWNSQTLLALASTNNKVSFCGWLTEALTPRHQGHSQGSSTPEGALPMEKAEGSTSSGVCRSLGHSPSASLS